MAKTANQLIKQAYEIAKTMPPAQAAIIKELATVLDVSNVALRQTRTERDALLAEVKSWAKECDRLTERHTKKRTNMHVLEAMRDLKAICRLPRGGSLMAKDSKVVWRQWQNERLTFEPENLHLVTDKTHPLYDERIHLPISEAMVLNIMDQGVLEPIIVWKDPETGLSCVVDGRQRVRHTLEANKRLLKEGKEPLLVPAVTKRARRSMAQAMVSANEIRQADTPLGRAKKMADALERGHDEDDLALMFGVSVQTVRATLSLLDATQAVKDAVESGTVTVTQARQLASLKPEEQREKVSEIEAATAGTTGHEKARRQRQISVKQSRVSNHAKKSQKPSKVPAVNMLALRWVLGEAV
jgi:ParB family chromosome partitioning protein